MNRLDASKILYNSDRLIDIRERGDSYPVHMQIGLTDYCNHKCVFCYSDSLTGNSARVNTIDQQALLRFLSEAKKRGLKAVTIVGTGEPLLHPKIVDILYGIQEIGLEIGVFTNGSKLSGETADAIIDTCTFVRVSINGANTKEHELIHRVENQFEKIIDNVTNIVKHKKERGQIFPTIGIQFVFFEKNFRSIVDAVKLWKKVGVDYISIKPLIGGAWTEENKTVCQTDDIEALISIMNQAGEEATEDFAVYTKYDQLAHTIKKERNYKICYGHSIDANLLADGNLSICCNLYEDEYTIGNIYRESFDSIWNGEKRKEVVKNIDLRKCPIACRCDPLNEVIWDYLNPDKSLHPNFI